MKGPAACLLASLALLIAAPVASQVGGGARSGTHAEFRREFDAGRYEAALPLAQELVRQLEAEDPPGDQLPTAYNNLGVVQLRSGDPAGAEASFDRALDLLEMTQGIASRRMIAPLAGLAAVYSAQGQPDRAAEALQRAVGISRRASGLFNLEQLELLEALVDNYEALGTAEGVENESRYILQVLQKQYGVDDPRTLPITTRLARWYERTERYAMARAFWVRAAQLGSREGSGRNAATIEGLIGIARTHRLQYVRDPDSMAEPVPLDPFSSRADALALGPVRPQVIRLDDEGEKAALQALEILDATTDPPRALLASATLELGDWYTTAREPEQALPYYERAWTALQESLSPGEANPLAVPRPLLYRPPSFTYRNVSNPGVEFTARRMEFNLSVAATGEVVDVTPVSSEAQEGQTQAVQNALRKAWFSPRFENGRAVPATGFLFTAFWYDIASPEPPEATEQDAGETKPGD